MSRKTRRRGRWTYFEGHRGGLEVANSIRQRQPLLKQEIWPTYSR